MLIYFSGHGTHVPDDNGDETDDNKDEALVLHDTRSTEPAQPVAVRPLSDWASDLAGRGGSK